MGDRWPLSDLGADVDLGLGMSRCFDLLQLLLLEQLRRLNVRPRTSEGREWLAGIVDLQHFEIVIR